MVFGLLQGILGGAAPEQQAITNIQGQINLLTTEIQALRQQAQSLGSVPQKLIEINASLTNLQNNFMAMQQLNLPESISGVESDLNAFKTNVQTQFGEIKTDITALRDQYKPVDTLQREIVSLRDQITLFKDSFPSPPELLRTGVLRVELLDQKTFRPIPNANIEIVYDSTTRTQTTDIDGKATFMSVPSDKYIRVRAAPSGYSLAGDMFQIQSSVVTEKRLTAYPLPGYVRPERVLPPAISPVIAPTIEPRLTLEIERIEITAPEIATIATLSTLDMASQGGSVDSVNIAISGVRTAAVRG